MTRIADIAGSWTVLVTTPAGETVAAGNWPDLSEAHGWAREINQGQLARVRGLFPLVLARDLRIELERGVWG
ncbi:hypothetical protein LWP59_27655 [Amycolatopsis acidiphila]|uniref:Uncharacterized protein n=1 Tax=Amycolatopsis acidiphila TaxID=715473 RepID=A0A558A126_9PSEU|nr:hypothetical protein [Amycolatopsis acidiphila]TVT17969.1 hypothetical protein FNH06_29550 [Amycolatopsis acidiphila]UIJ57870.1 hypothetical protein LWP59_27540 [Amycolatopsis acidiphila]UIJ57892.1 hypothetical protein LWP59_27655 [Amycolatopsis acidiphila]GHG71293.1 hypothetical protein GCM10017788_33110 [Amycolatopsis acidiphila]